MHSLPIRPESFTGQKKTNQKQEIVEIEVFINEPTKRHQMQILPDNKRPSISKNVYLTGQTYTIY